MDNVKLVNRLESTSLQPGSMVHPRMHEESSPLACIHCFLAYAAIHCLDPFTRDMLAYARLILGEAMCHRGSGWLEYDRAARQQRAIDPAKPWNVLDPGLHSGFILSRSSAAAVKHCTACQGIDHTSQCALVSIEPAVQQAGMEPCCHSYNCASWNREACSFPGTCSYCHVCSICFGTHKARECLSARGNQAPPQSRRCQQISPKQ